MSKRRLAYIGISSAIVLTTIFLGVHSVGTSAQSAHGQFIATQRFSPKYSQVFARRDPRKTERFTKAPLESFEIVHPEWASANLVTIEDQLLKAMPTRAPPKKSSS